MSYQKQNFANGNVLTAENLNHMENGISDVESTANATKYVVDNIIDPTLTLSGKAADAKATGDAFDAIMLMLVTGQLTFGLYTSTGDALCTSTGDTLIATKQIGG